MESEVTIGQGKAAFPPGGAEAAGRAEGTCRGRFLSSFPVPPSRPVPPPPLSAGLRSSLRASARRFLPLRVPRRLSAALRRSRPGRFKRPRGVAPRPPPAAGLTGKVSTRRRAPGEGEARTLSPRPREPREPTASRRGRSEPAARTDRRTDGRARAAGCPGSRVRVNAGGPGRGRGRDRVSRSSPRQPRRPRGPPSLRPGPVGSALLAGRWGSAGGTRAARRAGKGELGGWVGGNGPGPDSGSSGTELEGDRGPSPPFPVSGSPPPGPDSAPARAPKPAGPALPGLS